MYRPVANLAPRLVALVVVVVVVAGLWGVDGVVGSAEAAVVKAVTGPTKNAPNGTAYVELDDGERVAAGGFLKRVGKRGKLSGKGLEVLAVYDKRALIKVAKRTRVRVGAKLRVHKQTKDGTAAPEPPKFDRTGRDWQVEKAREVIIALTGGEWTDMRAKPRRLIKWRGISANAGGGDRARGDIRLVGIAVHREFPEQTWVQMRLGSRLEAPRLFGLPIAYAHDVSVYFDTIGADQGGQRARRLLEVRRLEFATQRSAQRSWNARGGRILVADGSGWQTVDGASVGLKVGDKLRISAYGGLGPDIVSSRIVAATQRFGAAVGYESTDASGDTNATLGYSGSLYDGALDRQLVGVRLHHQRGFGTVNADVDVAVGQPDLPTGYNAFNQSPVRLHRAWLGFTSQRFADAVARVRYSYYATQAWREVLATMPTDALIQSDRHNVVLSLDWRRADGPWLSPMVFGGYADAEDRFDGGRLGAGISGGFAGDAWSIYGGGSHQMGFSQTIGDDDDSREQRNGHIDRTNVFAGTRYRVNRALGVGLRLSGTQSRIWPYDASARRVRARLSADWFGPPWTVTATIGADRALEMEPVYDDKRVNFFDAALLIRRSLP